MIRILMCLVLLWCSTGYCVDRPASTPAGVYFVVGPRLFTPTGQPKMIRGVNHPHYDQPAAVSGIALARANTVRISVSFLKSQAYNWAVVDPFVTTGVTPIISNWNATCKSDLASFNAVVDYWVAQTSTWTRYNQTGLINIANEWGPASTVWRDAYIAAIQRMRLAGYNGTLVVDAPNCGQGAASVVSYGPAVLASDPQRNILFDVHVYGMFHYPATASWMQDYNKTMTELRASGLPILLGEFGPAPYKTDDGVVHNVGPSPTYVPTDKLISDAEANGFGWLAWAWDDNNLAGCLTSDIGWFGMTKNCAKYTGNDSTELTAFGRKMVPILKAYAASDAAR